MSDHGPLILGMVAGVALALGLCGAVIWYIFFKPDRARAAAEGNAERILDETFNGRQDVSFDFNMSTLKYDTLVIGARERGYRVVGQATNQYGSGTVVFEKLESPRADPA